MPIPTAERLKQKIRTLTLQIAGIEKVAQSKIKPLKRQLNQLQAKLKRLCPHEHIKDTSISAALAGTVHDYRCEDCGSYFSSNYNKQDRKFLQQRGIIQY